MATAFHTPGLSSNAAFGRPRASSFGRLNFGPRFNEGEASVARADPSTGDTHEFSLYYRVYNPSSLHSEESPPLVVIHGGPSLPSSYLYPLAHQFSTSRSIVFYDQLGCGQSSQPEDRRMYSIENAVDDLQKLIHTLGLDKFHLLGHSFGGIVAYEYVRTKADQSGKCLSLILDSTPSNMKTSLDESSRLEDGIRSELTIEESKSEDSERLVHDKLRRQVECRLQELPDPLLSAIETRGTTFGPEEVSDYVAHPPNKHSLPAALLIRGEYDFVTERCIEGWREIFNTCSCAKTTAYREEEMRNCAHYCHLEDAQGFGDLVKSHCFINDY